MSRLPQEKLLDRSELLRRHGRPRTGTLVFTNGVFDLLHAGHVEYLSAARALGDRLVVGVNTDDSVRRLGKGSDRPYQTEADRALLLAGLEAVDAVCLFDEDTPGELLEALLPDVLVKGGDYRPDQIVGRDAVVSAGGRVEVIPFLPGRSTTRLVQHIRGEGQ